MSLMGIFILATLIKLGVTIGIVLYARRQRIPVRCVLGFHRLWHHSAHTRWCAHCPKHQTLITTRTQKWVND